MWTKQIELRKEVERKTQDNLSVFEYTDDAEDSHTTIREKDKIFSELYKSEHMRNAGPYARLKFAMDYWCALWFWPIDKAELLPSRSEFLFDMSLILEGTTQAVLVTDIETDKKQTKGQLSLFPTEMQQLEFKILDQYDGMGLVDIPALRKQEPRLDLAAHIAEQNKFMHWELEFADLFAERGGFDLIIGNPPWIKIEWNEQGVLADSNPMFAVKKLTATQTTYERESALENNETRKMYFSEYESMSGEQNFLGAMQNYPDLSGAVNLFKCFLPLAWENNNNKGVSAFVHPEGVYDDPKGGTLRGKMYPRLRYHFQFANERKLFPEVDHHTTFSLNVYGNPQIVSFNTICNLYDVKSIIECYEGDTIAIVPGIKNKNGEWNIKGHPDRVIQITKRELMLFAKLFDGNENWKQARLPALHAKELVEVLECFASQKKTLGSLENGVFTTEMWNETGAQKDGTIKRYIHFPESLSSMIYSGPHFSVANPMFKTSRSICKQNSDYDNLDLTNLPDQYMQRCNYLPACSKEEYLHRIPETPWGTKYTEEYRIMHRRMLNQSGERTLTCAIARRATAHVNTVISLTLNNSVDMVTLAGCEASIPYDTLIKCCGKSDLYFNTMQLFPIVDANQWNGITIRSLLLNCLTRGYEDLWYKCFDQIYVTNMWSKQDLRISNTRFTTLTSEWTWNTPLRTDYERRQALVEIDVLTAMALGMTLQQLKTIYRIQFPVLQSYEADTWYDASGRITFTNNRSLTGVGFSRPEWENAGAVQPVRRSDAPWDGVMKHAPAGYVFARTIMDDTMPGGPVERTIEYVAPFDRCDREQDYETAWRFFEKKYRNDK